MQITTYLSCSSFEVNRMTLSPKKLISNDNLEKRCYVLLIDGKALLFFSLARFSSKVLVRSVENAWGSNFQVSVLFPAECLYMVFISLKLGCFLFFLPHIGKRAKVSYEEKVV